MWAESYTLTFKVNKSDGTAVTSTTPIADILSEGANYVSSIDAANMQSVYYAGGSGLKLGASSSTGILGFNLSDAGQVKATTIVVSAKLYNSSKPAKISVNGATEQSLGKDFQDYTFNVNSDINNIVLTSTKYCWVQSVTVNFTVSSNPSISASDVTLESDATSGEIAYTIANPVEGKSLTASTDADWISNLTVSTDKVTFTTTANTGAERTADVTFKYDGATDKVVKVTQKKSIPTYASLAELVADGSPSETETTVKVTLTNEKIVGKASTYIILQSGEQKVKIYKSGCPDWEVGGTVSGTITCPWVLFNKIDWELQIKDWNELTYNEPIVTKYAITIDPDMVNGSIVAKLNGSAVTEAAEGKEITLEVTPDDGYRLSSNTLIVLDENAEEVALDVNKFTMPASKVLVSAEFEAIPTHAVKFFVNGEQYGATQTLEEGENVIFPEKPANIGTKVFTGWTESAIDGTTNTAPTFVASATVGDADLNYYAVFATSSPGESETATLNATGLSTGSYKTGSKKDNKNQTWTYYAAVNNQSGTLYFRDCRLIQRN